MIALRYMGDGDFQAPIGHAKRLDKALVIGEVLHWEQVNQRSSESHKHYFAIIAEAWGNLPEDLGLELPSPEHLRKYALCKAGYCTVNKVVCRTNADAIQACMVLAAMDSFAICEVSGSVVTVYRAKSQSMKAMGGKVFQESKERVLQVISEMIGADATQARAA